MLGKFINKVKALFKKRSEMIEKPAAFEYMEHGHYFDHESQPIIVKEIKPNVEHQALCFLPSTLRKRFQENANAKLYILDKVSMKIFIMDVLSMKKMEQSKDPDDEFLVSTLKTLNYGYLNDQCRDIFTLITKENDRRIPYLLADSDWMDELDQKVWWNELNITIPNLRHVRVSGYETNERVYALSLNEWFKPVERPKYPEKKTVKPLFYSSPNINKETKYFNIRTDNEVIHVIIKKASLNKREMDEMNNLLAETLKTLRENYPRDKIIITDENTGESYQVLKQN